ncbi:hypothetical protein FACS18942_06300 [Planctomycetales bacterium]|nr:hypothetical protein FACS18942_06300 [Planctomycetales bacterium]
MSKQATLSLQVCTFILAGLIFQLSAVFASDKFNSEQELMLKFAESQISFSENNIYACRIDYTLNSFSPKNSEKQISDIEKTRQSLLKSGLDEKRIQNLINAVRENGMKPREIKGKYTKNTFKNGNVLYLGTVQYLIEKDNWSSPTSFLGVQSINGIYHVSYDEDTHIAFVLAQSATAGDFESMGRLYGQNFRLTLQEQFEAEKEGTILSDIIREKIAKTDCFRSGEIKYDDSTATVIEIKKNGQLFSRYCIDTARGYICPKIENYNTETGKLAEEYIANGFVQIPNAGLWYPLYFCEILYDKNSGELASRKEYRIDKSDLQINQQESEKVFAIDVPENTKIIDQRTKDKVEYTAVESGSISPVHGILNLEAMKWLERNNHLDNYVLTKKSINTSFRIILIVIGLILIFISLFLRTRRKLLLVFIALFLCTGCGRIENKQTVILTVNPSSIDFGSVHITESPLIIPFSITNNSDSPVQITDVVTGCGCTTVDIPNNSILPGKPVVTAVKVNLLGRIGDFTNQIILKTANNQNVIYYRRKRKLFRK